MKYRPEIDGLRALAVVPVILFHAGFGAFSGGYVGVDVFFVISGYLITTIILTEMGEGRFSLVRFYERRARRILPALILVTLVSLAFGWVFLNPIAVKSLATSVIGVATFTSNILFWLGKGYFEEASELMPLIHTWSLAVEEQYYVIFPVALMLLVRAGLTRFAPVFIVLAVISLAVSVWAVSFQTHPRIVSGAFFLLPTRGWELLLGGVAALMLMKQRGGTGSGLHQMLAAVGIGAILLSVMIYDAQTAFPGLAALLPTVGTFLVIVYGTGNTFAGRLLSSRLLVGLGLISYSLYLWHQPLFAFYRHIQGTTAIDVTAAVLLILASGVLSFITWKLVETPFRRRDFLSAKRLLSASFVALLAVGICGALTRLTTSGYEDWLAKDLAKYDYVYFGNLDERRFMESRFRYETRQPEIIVMGSSRMMQVGSRTLDGKVINLSVSGASVEDYVALVGEATAKFDIRAVYLGADPWLFNETSGQLRWKSVAGLYSHWTDQIRTALRTGQPAKYPPLSDQHDAPDAGLSERLFRSVNRSAFRAETGKVEAQPKRAFDGFHINSELDIARTEQEIKGGFPALLNYAMATYTPSETAIRDYSDLIRFLKLQNIEVFVVLPPYHPEMIAVMRSQKPVFLEIEDRFRKLADQLSVPVLGSYDAGRASCPADDFYDGMHPKEACMQRILMQNPN
ncbi:MAG: acyltransferase family protein [Rhodospirillales bacterium]